MKRLMIAAAIVCAAAYAQAGAISWDVTDCYTFVGPAASSSTKIGEAASENYAFYFFVEDGDFTRDSAITAFKDGDTSFLANGYLTEWADVGEYGYEDGSWTGKVNAFYMLFNAADAADATYAFVGAAQEVSLPLSGISGDFSDTAAASATGSNWVQAAPEPTTGLLMLFGLAGLALKRRRA